jgi:hypothetical protein
MTKNKAFRSAVVLILLVLALYGVYLGWIKKDMSDFGVPYKNALRLMRGETLYRVSDGHLQFKYAPVSVFLYMPLTLLPYEAAKVVWYYLEIVFLFFVFRLCYRVLPDKRKGPWFVAGITFLVMLKFIGREFELGQVNTFILLLLMLMLDAFLKKKDAAAGLFWGLSVFFKPYALVFFPYVLLKRRWKAAGVGIGILLAGLVLPSVIYGVRGNLRVLAQWGQTLSHSTPGLMTVGDNASLYALIWKLLPGSDPATLAEVLWIGAGLLLAGMFVGMMLIARSKSVANPEILEMSFLFVLIPLFSPLGWYYNYLYAVPAVALLLNFWSSFPRAWKYFVGIDLLLIGGTLREVLGKTLFRFYTHNHFVAANFLVIVAALAYLRLSRPART